MKQPPQASTHVQEPIPTPQRSVHENWSDPITICDHFASAWLKDACEEAQKLGRDARRREVLFAICFAESYLFEWVRNEVVGSNTSALNCYFAPGERTDVRTKWKEIPKQLLDDGRIPRAPDLASWQAFCRLVDYRNGVVHARASRPQQAGQPEQERPMPSGDQLDQLEPGWATQVVIDLVKGLHAAVDSSPEDWFMKRVDELG